MKILFINISDIKGGAAKAMYRLGKTLEQRHGTTNLFLVRSKFSDDDNVIQTRRGWLRGRIEWAVNFIFNIGGLQYKWLPFSPRKILKEAKRFKPDVISLNQIEGGYFVTRDIIKLSKIAPIFWTFHDMWAFTGNASNTYGNEAFKLMQTFKGENKIYPQTGFNNAEWLMKRKYDIYFHDDLGINNFRTITPSKWLAKEAGDSAVLWDTADVIPNGVDLERFSPKPVKNLLFVSEKTDKGDLLPEILSKLDGVLTEKVQLTVVGEGDILGYYIPEKAYKNIIVTNKGYTSDEDDLVFYYRQADIYLHPTRADNCPLTLLEALACGTPVVAFNVGGVGEIIHHGYDGFLIKPFLTGTFAGTVAGMIAGNCQLSDMKITARNSSTEFNINTMAERYYELFKK